MVPNPKQSTVTEAIKALVKGKDIKKIYCAKYDQCLDYAVAFKWKGFKCTECKVDERMREEQEISDSKALIELAAEILGKNG
jgi:hypothetical protein